MVEGLVVICLSYSHIVVPFFFMVKIKRKTTLCKIYLSVARTYPSHGEDVSQAFLMILEVPASLFSQAGDLTDRLKAIGPVPKHGTANKYSAFFIVNPETETGK